MLNYNTIVKSIMKYSMEYLVAKNVCKASAVSTKKKKKPIIQLHEKEDVKLDIV